MKTSKREMFLCCCIWCNLIFRPLRADPAGCGSPLQAWDYPTPFLSVSLYSWSFPFTWALRFQPWISIETTDSQCRSAPGFITVGTLVTAQTVVKTPPLEKS